MPFEAAKAVTATFCYNIRHVLTPVFGNDFLFICTSPKDPNFAKFLIGQDIIYGCTVQSERWRLESEDRRTPARQRSITVSTPRSQFAYVPWTIKSLKKRQSKCTDVESGYGTDTDQSGKYLFSPQVSPTTQAWTSINRPRSPRDPGALPVIISSKPWLSSVSSSYEEGPPGSKRGLSDLNEESDYDSRRPVQPIEGPSKLEHELSLSMSTREMTAARLMLQLSMADAALQKDHPAKRNRCASNYSH